MANKWKYSTTPASERLDMVRSGNKDVYNSEIERSLDVINSRKSLGLDISDQKDWIDSVSYNYNLYNASKMGIDAKDVNKTGYADRILNDGSSSKKKVRAISVSKKADADYYADKYLDEFYTKVSEAAKKRGSVLEWLLNNGIDKDSEIGRKYLDDFDKELDEVTEKYRKEYISKVKAAIK